MTSWVCPKGNLRLSLGQSGDAQGQPDQSVYVYGPFLAWAMLLVFPALKQGRPTREIEKMSKVALSEPYV